MSSVKIGKPVIRKDGRYMVNVDSGIDMMTGKRIRKSFYGKTITETVAKAEAYAEKVKAGEVVGCQSLVFQTVVDEFIKDITERDSMKAASLDKLQQNIVLHVLPFWGDRNITTITVDDIQKFSNIFADKRYTTKKTGEIPYSYSVYKKTIQGFGQVMDFAYRRGYILTNPVKRFRKASRQEYERKVFGKDYVSKVGRARTLSRDEIVRLKDECLRCYETGNQKYKHGEAYLLLLYTGMRASECLGLKWCDIDFENDRIDVCRVLTYYKDRDDNGQPTGRMIATYQTPKTVNSVRTIPMSPEAKEILLQIYEKEYWGADAPVIVSTEGNPIYLTAFEKTFRTIVRNARLNGVTLHTLRHTFGSYLYEKTQDLLLVSKMLGHGSVQITANVYLHAREDKMNQVMKGFQIGMGEM